MFVGSFFFFFINLLRGYVLYLWTCFVGPYILRALPFFFFFISFTIKQARAKRAPVILSSIIFIHCFQGSFHSPVLLRYMYYILYYLLLLCCIVFSITWISHIFTSFIFLPFRVSYSYHGVTWFRFQYLVVYLNYFISYILLRLPHISAAATDRVCIPLC